MSTPVALAQVLAARDARPGLASAAQALSARYRDGIVDATPALRGDLDREAYAQVRMPATAAAVAAALGATLAVAPLAPGSHLDLGSGTGAALWAVADRLPTVTRRTAIERDAGAIALARELAAGDLPGVTWLADDLRQPLAADPHDLVTISYALNELIADERDRLVLDAWERTACCLLLVEPGTPRGAEAIQAARRLLLAAGAHPLAPCPHAGPCPLMSPSAGAPGWCHQRVRLGRSRLHRAAKGAACGFEDEPFAYFAAARHPAASNGDRVVAPPQVDAGAVLLPLCTAAGFALQRVVRRERGAYAAAKRLAWGDRWQPPISAAATDPPARP